jgi:hypothetical protein
MDHPESLFTLFYPKERQIATDFDKDWKATIDNGLTFSIQSVYN